MGKSRDLFKKIRHQGNISCKDRLNKGQKWQASEGTGAGRGPQEVTCHFLAIGGLWEYGLSVATPANFSRKVTNLHVE